MESPASPGTRVSGTDESQYADSSTPSLDSSSSSGKTRRMGDEPPHEKLKKAVPGGSENIGGGLLSGVGSMLAGVAGGAAALVAAPIMGARDAGPKGAAVGLAAGVVAFVALPVAGVVSGIGEVVAGVANTPSAMQAKAQGKEWDEHAQQYTEYSLPEELERLRSVDVDNAFSSSPVDSAAEGGERKATAPVAATGMYDALGVDPAATESELKRAYYKRSLRLHPDKNPDDPDASTKFQEVARAYQVLSDPVMRARYDKGGEAGIEEGEQANRVDAKMMFEIFFGTEKFENLVGQVPMVVEMSVDRPLPPEEKKFRQLLRETKVAMHLAELVSPYVDGSLGSAGFSTWAATFAEELTDTPFGLRLLHCLGSSYVHCAEDFLSSLSPIGIPDQARLSVSATARSVTTRVTALTAAASAASAAAKAERSVKESEEAERKSDSERGDTGARSPAGGRRDKAKSAAAEVAQEAAFDFANMLWRVLVIDVEATLKRAMHKVLHDRAVNVEARERRARALRVLGNAFRTTCIAPRTRELEVALPRGARGLILERTYEGALRLGAVGNELAAAGLAEGDVVVAVGGERLVGYNHAKVVAPWLLATVGHTEADGGKGQAEAGSDEAEGEGAALRITVCRTAPEDKRTKTWREQVAAQIGGGGGGGGAAAAEAAASNKANEWKERAEHSIFDNVLPKKADSSDSPSRTWKERAGRHSGGDGWHYGDVTRSMLRALGGRARGVLDSDAHADMAEADMAGEIGKRSEVTIQYHAHAMQLTCVMYHACTMHVPCSSRWSSSGGGGGLRSRATCCTGLTRPPSRRTASSPYAAPPSAPTILPRARRSPSSSRAPPVARTAPSSSQPSACATATRGPWRLRTWTAASTASRLSRRPLISSTTDES